MLLLGEPVHEDVAAEGYSHGEDGGVGVFFVVNAADDPVGFVIIGAVVKAGGLV